jgi:hypothetical protein
MELALGDRGKKRYCMRKGFVGNISSDAPALHTEPSRTI